MIYFDNAATSFPKPKEVSMAAIQAITRYGGNPGRSGHELSLKTSEKIYQVRQNIANFFNAEIENVIFTQNCTHALNMAIKGIMLTGGHVVTSPLEHNSVSRPLNALEKQGIITFSVAKGLSVSDFEREITSDTKAIVCTHASNVTGKILPVHEIGALCNKYDLLFVVDCAQSAGVLPIDIKEMNIDIMCTAGHKSLYGTTGTGLMIIGERVEKLHTIIEGGTGSASIEINQPDFYPDRFESGTINTVGILSLGAGLVYVKKLGTRRIYKYEFELCQFLRQMLEEIPNVHLYADNFQFGEYVPIVIFNIDNMNSMEVVDLLSKKGFGVRGGLHCAPWTHRYMNTLDIGTVRFAPSTFNSKEQVRNFAEAIKKIANQ